MKFSTLLGLALIASSASANAVTVSFFDSTQTAEVVASGITSDTISSNGYLFTYTLDKLFTGGTGSVIGRPIRVNWPDGVEAQAVTTGPVTGKAQITLSRIDGAVFDIEGFGAKLLGNTWATGAAIEVMPLVNGEDAFNDPFMFDASGSYGMNFLYSPTATSMLQGYDTYKFTLFVDYAMTSITLVDASVASVPVPATFWLLGSGLIGLACTQRKRSTRA